MKARIGTFFLLLVASYLAAHDGPGIGSSVWTGVSIHDKHFIGLSWTTSTYQHSDIVIYHDDGSARMTFPRKEVLSKVRLNTGFKLKNKWLIEASIPFISDRLKINEQTNSKKGLGDLLLKVNYNLFEPDDSCSKAIAYFARTGAGLELPTGTSALVSSQLNTDYSFIISSGSVDFVVDFVQRFQINNLGLETKMAFRHNTKGNAINYSMNTLDWNATVHYSMKMGKLMVMTYATLQSQRNWSQEPENALIKNNSTEMQHMLSAGMRMGFKRSVVEAGFHYPILTKVNEDIPAFKNQISIQLIQYF
ncbi:MAG: hypothetical protein AAF502_00605 [Bacteroidota bacterium]